MDNTTANICKGFKKNRRRCNRKVDKGIDFCWQHNDQTIGPEIKKVYKTPIRSKIDNTKSSIQEVEKDIEYIGNLLSKSNISEDANDVEDDKSLKLHELCERMAVLNTKKTDLNNFLDECLEKEKNMSYSEKSFKVRHFENGSSASKDKDGVFVSEQNEKSFKRMMDIELKIFNSKQRNFIYKKNRNKKV
jgi:hypothetical protein